MELNLKNPSEVKVSLLSYGIDCDIDTFRRYEGDFYANLYVYGNTNQAEKYHRFPQVLLLGNDVVSAFLQREGSPWTLKIEDGSPDKEIGIDIFHAAVKRVYLSIFQRHFQDIIVQ